jgi:hypothetical protein
MLPKNQLRTWRVSVAFELLWADERVEIIAVTEEKDRAKPLGNRAGRPVTKIANRNAVASVRLESLEVYHRHGRNNVWHVVKCPAREVAGENTDDSNLALGGCLNGVRKGLSCQSGRSDSNRRRPAWEAGILPLNYARDCEQPEFYRPWSALQGFSRLYASSDAFGRSGHRSSADALHSGVSTSVLKRCMNSRPPSGEAWW